MFCVSMISSHHSAAAAWSQLTSPKAASPGLAQRAACIDLEWSSVENCLSRNDFLKHRNICLAFKCHATSNKGNNMAVQQAPKLRDSVIQYKLTQNDMVVSHCDCTFFQCLVMFLSYRVHTFLKKGSLQNSLKESETEDDPPAPLFIGASC